MKFKELRDRVVAADNQAVADWQERVDDWVLAPPTLGDRVSFNQFRMNLIGEAVLAILTELAARDEASETETCPRCYGSPSHICCALCDSIGTVTQRVAQLYRASNKSLEACAVLRSVHEADQDCEAKL